MMLTRHTLSEMSMDLLGTGALLDGRLGPVPLPVPPLSCRYGHPVPTQVRITPVKGKAVLISGHDMTNLEALLKQTEGKVGAFVAAAVCSVLHVFACGRVCWLSIDFKLTALCDRCCCSMF